MIIDQCNFIDGKSDHDHVPFKWFTWELLGTPRVVLLRTSGPTSALQGTDQIKKKLHRKLENFASTNLKSWTKKTQRGQIGEFGRRDKPFFQNHCWKSFYNCSFIVWGSKGWFASIMFKAESLSFIKEQQIYFVFWNLLWNMYVKQCLKLYVCYICAKWVSVLNGWWGHSEKQTE